LQASFAASENAMEMDVKQVLQLGIVLTMALAVSPARSDTRTGTADDNQRKAAFALEQQGNNAEAEAAWRAVLKQQPSNAEAYAHLGFLEARQKRYAEAVPLYRKASALDPAIPGLQLNLGLSLFKSGALKDAIATFTPLLKSEPASSPEAIRLTTLIGLAHYGLGDYAAAVPDLKIAAEYDPQNLPFRLALAHSCLWSKQYQCVLDEYHEILTLNAESAEADMLAGEALDEMKDNAGAVEQFRAAVKADPREPNVHFGLGYLLWGLMKYEEAAQEFQAELANNPEHAQALTYLADTDMQLSHTEAASPLLEKALKIDPSITLAHVDLGLLYSEAGRKDDALAELKIAENLSPNDVNVHWRLARFYQAAGQKEEAKAEFEKTRGLQKSADASIMTKLKDAQAKGKPTEQGDGATAAK
jgi:tetratricopeptide (TPR) repeat protein